MGVARSLGSIPSLTAGVSELCILLSVVESVDALTCNSLTAQSWRVQPSGGKDMQNGPEPHMPFQHPGLRTLHTGSLLFAAIMAAVFSFSKHALFAPKNILLSGSWQSALGTVPSLFTTFLLLVPSIC